MKHGLWIYRAEDEFGLPIAEAYRKTNLINKLIDEFGKEKVNSFKIVRIFERGLH